MQWLDVPEAWLPIACRISLISKVNIIVIIHIHGCTQMKLHTILFSTFCNVGYNFSHLLLFFIYLHMQPKFLLFLVGPSYCIDTACSSSLLALDHALAAMRSGLCQAAVVAGCSLCLKPSTSLQFDRLSKDWIKSFHYIIVVPWDCSRVKLCLCSHCHIDFATVKYFSSCICRRLLF